MSTRPTSIAHLLNEIRAGEIVLPDLQRDFVWDPDQIRLLFDTIMQEYPFGSLLLWDTRFLETPYREFVLDYRERPTFVPKLKDAGKKMRMVLDGQQRLQSLYLGRYGSHDGKRLYFNVASGPGWKDQETAESTIRYRFEFWQDDERENRPKRLIRVTDILSWAPRAEEAEIKRVVQSIPLEGEEADRAAANMRSLRRLFSQSDLVPIETIDEEAASAEQARNINEILEIFVRVNSGGTRLSRSDLMFSLIKIKWRRARQAFDDLLADVDPDNTLGIDKDFVIRGLLLVADAPLAFAVETIERHWEAMDLKFDSFAAALKSSIDFCRDPEVGIVSASLLQPVATLYPLIYYLSQQKSGSVPEDQRRPLRTVLYFLLFNDFLRGKSPEARLRWLRDLLKTAGPDAIPVDSLLAVIREKQSAHSIVTTPDMLNWRKSLALNIVQPGVRRQTLAWQARAEVDHIFPQSVYREKFPTLIDDIGNLAFLGKLRNIRKSADPPWEYFRDVSDDELQRDYLVDRALLAEDKFEEFVAKRRERILETVRDFLGR
jgi:hypothetical protein